jgi:hypothetical protein
LNVGYVKYNARVSRFNQARNKLAAITVRSFSSEHMNSLRITASWRAVSKPVLAGALVLLLFLSALASASPSLHHWLHSDHQSPSHYCVITAVEHGQTDIASVWVSIVPAAVGIPVAALPCESFFISHDLTLHPERGPPVLS